MSDLNKIKTRLFEQIIAESILEALDFENIEPYEGGEVSLFKTPLGMVKISLDEKTSFDFSISKDNRVIVKQSYDFYGKKLKNAYPKIYNVGYSINGVDTQYAKSDYITLIKILYTVMVYVKKKYLEDKKDNNSFFGVFITATPKDNSKASNLSNIDPQKNMIYKRIIMNNIPDGYEVSDAKLLSRRPGFLIYKKTLPNKK
jgi:hypothetical protein